MDSDNILLKILEWAWIGIVGMIVHIYRKLMGHDTQHKILNEARTAQAEQRREDQERHKEDRKEVMDTIIRHNTEVMNKFDRIETVIRKNGHS
jgi:hypothetical protein